MRRFDSRSRNSSTQTTTSKCRRGGTGARNIKCTRKWDGDGTGTTSQAQTADPATGIACVEILMWFLRIDRTECEDYKFKCPNVTAVMPEGFDGRISLRTQSGAAYPRWQRPWLKSTSEHDRISLQSVLTK